MPDPEDDGFTCFEILGFDIMFRKNYDPILVEVNHSPSLTCDTPLDKNIKYGMLTETMRLIKVSGQDRRKEAQRTAAGAQSRLYAGFKKGGGEGIKDAEREILLRERGWHSRMSKRKAHERKVSSRFHLIHPTEEAIALCTRKEMSYIDAKNGHVEEEEAGGDTKEKTSDAIDQVVKPCLDARRLQSFGRPYRLFRDEAARVFAESTLGMSPVNKSKNRQLLSTQVPRPLDYHSNVAPAVGQQQQQQQHHLTIESNGRQYVMPTVNGQRYEEEEFDYYNKEYRGEREKGGQYIKRNNSRQQQQQYNNQYSIHHNPNDSGSMTTLQRLKQSHLPVSPSSLQTNTGHLPQTLGSHMARLNQHNVKGIPTNLHKNSVLHSNTDAQRSIQYNSSSSSSSNHRGGATRRVDFTAYMSKIHKARDVEAEYRQMINKQLTRIDYHTKSQQQMQSQQQPMFERLVDNQSSKNNNQLRRGLPSMDRQHHHHRPASMGGNTNAKAAVQAGLRQRPVSSSRSIRSGGGSNYHHDTRSSAIHVVHNRSDVTQSKKSKKNKTTVIVPTKYKKVKKVTTLRMIGKGQAPPPSNRNTNAKTGTGAGDGRPSTPGNITHRNGSMGPKFTTTNEHIGDRAAGGGGSKVVGKTKRKKKAKKAKKKVKIGSGKQVKKKLTVQSLFQRVH